MTRPTDGAVLVDLARTGVGISTRATGRFGGVSVTRLRALTIVAATGGGRPGLFAAELGVPPSSASRLADRLVLAGLFRRGTAPTDRRGVVRRLTAEGMTVLERHDDLRLAELRALLDAVPDRPAVVEAAGRLVGSRSAAEAVR